MAIKSEVTLSQVTGHTAEHIILTLIDVDLATYMFILFTALTLPSAGTRCPGGKLHGWPFEVLMSGQKYLFRAIGLLESTTTI